MLECLNYYAPELASRGGNATAGATILGWEDFEWDLEDY